MLVVVLAFSSSVFYGVSDFIGGVAARRMPVLPMTTVSYALSAAVLVVACLIVPMQVTTGAIGAGVVAGLFAVVGFVAFYAAMAVGPMSTVAPVVAVAQSAVPVAYDITVGGQRPEPLGWLGILVGVVAAVLLGVSGGERHERPGLRVLALAVLGGATLGASNIALDGAPNDSGVLPIATDVMTGLVVLVVVLLAARASALLRGWSATLDVDHAVTGEPASDGRRWPSPVVLAAVAGALIGVGNVLLMLALHAGALAVVAVLMGLYPLSTVLLARLVLDERLSRWQVLGVGGAVGASVLLGLA